ncbi:Lin54 [Phodopus roborovskii]|uniref:Protein lin-54 homolog n=1 Tax=Phodopus roborovskii TaxID=109678 RepID=A0AAU9ZTF3_PHORO|nr:Lin54 [Phodopus roborovskii]
MEVVPAEVNSLLPEEIMDTAITLVDEDSIEAVIVSSPIPMETELEEIVNINSTGDSAAISTEPITVYNTHTNQVAVNTTVTKAESNTTVKPAFPSGLQKLGAQTPVTISANQIILNKVSQTSDLKLGNQTLKPDGQKLILTTLGKSGSPIVLALPHSQLPQAQKVTNQAQPGDAKLPPQQIKVVTIGGRPEVKPVIGVSALTPGSQLINTTTQPSVLQTQQLKTVQVVPKPMNSTSQIVTTSQPQQRLIMPATPLPQIQPNLTNLPPGTVLAPAPGTGNVGYAVLPAQYVTQLQQSSYVSIASNSNFTGTSGIQTQARLPFNGIIPSESASRPRKPCNCTKSLCLKLYCDCFANGEFCNNCNCTNCYNNLEHENERQKAIKACLDRNPEAFKPKIGKGKEGESDRRHSKGCNCKRSGCLKNYCECYEAKIMCSSICKCIGCKNFEESPERKTLMHLADAAEVRVQQQTAAKTKLSSQISDLLTRPSPALNSGGGKLPFTFVTKEVAEATCNCLLAQAEQADKKGKSKAAAERMILEEFGRCLMSVISSAGKAKSDPCAMHC